MQIGEVFVKEFYIVGVVPKHMPEGFFICGDHGVETNMSAQDGLYPCIGTDRATAEKQFKKAKAQYSKHTQTGTVVLIKFAGGVIEKMAGFDVPHSASIQE